MSKKELNGIVKSRHQARLTQRGLGLLLLATNLPSFPCDRATHQSIPRLSTQHTQQRHQPIINKPYNPRQRRSSLRHGYDTTDAMHAPTTVYRRRASLWHTRCLIPAVSIGNSFIRHALATDCQNAMRGYGLVPFVSFSRMGLSCGTFLLGEMRWVWGTWAALRGTVLTLEEDNGSIHH